MSAGDVSNRRDFSRKAVLAGNIPAMALAGRSTSGRDTSADVDISQAIQQLARTAASPIATSCRLTKRRLLSST